MRTLALETTESVGSIAALDDGAVLAEMGLPRRQRTAQSLAPSVAELLSQVGWNPRDVGVVAVSVGPGSFTGLRVGVTTAKTFAYAVDAHLVAVDTLEVVAFQAPRDVGPLWSVIDAQRQQVFAARPAQHDDGHFHLCRQIEILDIEEWLASLQVGDCVTGPALRRLAPRIPDGVKALPPSYWPATASAVGRLGWRQYQAGQSDNLWQLVPLYLRKSAAEEKRNAAEGSETDRP
jgi:tRNA threonylcarbamoyladenosine biosynthesis protein TsaB